MPFFRDDAPLDHWGNRILETTWAAFPELAQNQIALTWVIYDEPVPVNTGGALTPEEFWKYGVRGFAHRGAELIDSADVVKLFYLVAVQEWLEKGMLHPSSELDRAVRDMIVDSSDDATSLVLDVLTGTTSGPELPPGPFKTWQSQRNLINRYFHNLGWAELEKINVNQKTWCDGPYGRERIFMGEFLENRNQLTTNAVARLLHSIVGGVAVSSRRSQAMMALMQRSLNSADLLTSPAQVAGFLGEGIPATAQIWSKFGLNCQVRHDVAYIEIPGLRPYLLVVFLEGEPHCKNQAILPFISRQVVAALNKLD